MAFLFSCQHTKQMSFCVASNSLDPCESVSILYFILWLTLEIITKTAVGYS